VASVLHRHSGHHTVGDIQAYIEQDFPRAASIARSSVYRALEALEGAGLVVALRGAQEETRFEWDGTDAHHHLICDDCGHTREVRLASARTLEQEARSEHGFQAQVRHLALHGTCAPCHEERRTDPRHRIGSANGGAA
jgi:Fur family ferric uptake transcriptional regulator